MRLPRCISQSLLVHTVHYLTVGMVIALLGMLPMSAGAATAQLVCTPSSLEFGSIVVGQTETLLVTVTNNGETSVTVSKIAVSSSEFTKSDLSLPLVLSAGDSLDLNVSFTPTATKWIGGTVTVSSNASNATLALDLGGTGVSSEDVTASPSTVSFGDVAVGAKSTVPVVLKNDRSWTVTLSALQTTSSEFSMSGLSLPFALDAGKSVTVNVTFAPQSADTIGGSLFVSGPGLDVPLTGTGTGKGTQYSVNLSWDSSADVTGYNVYRSTSENGTYSKINSTLDPNTTYTDSTVSAGQTYYYAATSVNSAGQESARSTPAVEAVVP
jgi:Abnormal spindle-like microcephaly-assoc'd, ASPM-SPD-2-Hydin